MEWMNEIMEVDSVANNRLTLICSASFASLVFSYFQSTYLSEFTYLHFA